MQQRQEEKEINNYNIDTGLSALGSNLSETDPYNTEACSAYNLSHRSDPGFQNSYSGSSSSDDSYYQNSNNSSSGGSSYNVDLPMTSDNNNNNNNNSKTIETMLPFDTSKIHLEFNEVKKIKVLGEGHYGIVTLYEIISPEKLQQLREMELIPEDSNQIAIKTLNATMVRNARVRAQFQREGEINNILHQKRTAAIKTEQSSSPRFRILQNAALECHFNLACSGYGLDGQPFIASRVESGGNAANYIKTVLNDIDKHSKDDVMDLIFLLIMLIIDIWTGIEQIHDEGIINGDICLNNILIAVNGSNKNDIVAKLADFGLGGIFQKKYPDATFNNIQAKLDFQALRSDIGRSKFDLLTISTDLYAFRIAIMEIIAKAAHIRFKREILLKTEYRELSKVDPKNYQPSLLNHKIMADIYNRLEQALRDKVKSDDCYKNQTLLQLLTTLKPFLQWEEIEKAPSLQKSEAKAKLVVQLNEFLGSYPLESETTDLERLATSASKLNFFNLNSNDKNNNNANFDMTRSIAKGLQSPKFENRKNAVVRFFKETKITSGILKRSSKTKQHNLHKFV